MQSQHCIEQALHASIFRSEARFELSEITVAVLEGALHSSLKSLVLFVPHAISALYRTSIVMHSV